jgi:cytoskeletal protein RodZ
MKARIELEEIAEQTKISRRFLQAIEDGAYHELPGGVFTVSYIRQYARATGFSAEEILEHYRRRSGRVESDEATAGGAAGAPWWARFFPLG